MADYKQKLKDDLVEQFRGKVNIESLLEVLGEELQQVFCFYEQLRNERSVYNAVGKQLDGIGDIVALPRKEAARLAGLDSSLDISDELYRQYLVYKILKNTCDCTYESLISAIKMFWRGETVKYREDPNIPATIILTIKGFSDKENIKGLLEIPIIRAAGVAALMETETRMDGSIFVGVIQQHECKSIWTVEDYDLDVPDDNENASILTDESGNILVDENDKTLIYD